MDESTKKKRKKKHKSKKDKRPQIVAWGVYTKPPEKNPTKGVSTLAKITENCYKKF